MFLDRRWSNAFTHIHTESESPVEGAFDDWSNAFARAERASHRSERASAEKPPKTTECTAPMRAHASIATWSNNGQIMVK